MNSGSCTGQSQVPGRPAGKLYWDLTPQQRLILTKDIAKHLNALYHLRFPKIGSLQKDGTGFSIGPLVSMTYFDEDFDDVTRPPALNAERGPWTDARKWLQSIAGTELSAVKDKDSVEREVKRFVKRTGKRREDANALLPQGKRRLGQLVQLAAQYAGVPDDPSLSPSAFTLKLHDFRPTNFFIDEKTCKITGLIDFEAVGTAPLWACAKVPSWLELYDVSGWPSRGTETQEERAQLRKVFLDEMDQLDSQHPEHPDRWRLAFERGGPFRGLMYWSEYGWSLGCELEGRLEEALKEAINHPGRTVIYP
jgi:hypothetical protein